MIKKSARALAAEALFLVEEQGTWSEQALNRVLEDQPETQRRDVALATRLCYGVLQNTQLCDYYISKFSQRPLDKIAIRVQILLRLGAYQLLFMDKIPESAAVNDTVELVRRYESKSAVPFANAVLRSLAREKENLPPVLADSLQKKLSILYSHPVGLVGLLLKELGEAGCEAFLAENNKPTAAVLRVNPLKATVDEAVLALEEAGLAPSLLFDGAVACKNLGALQQLPLFTSGGISVQDGASQMAVLALQPTAGATVLDICAAPGGKSFMAAQIMGDEGSVISCDVYSAKLAAMMEQAERLGISCLTPVFADGRKVEEKWLGTADFVICDVPCSGLGIIRKKPEIRNKNLDEIKTLPLLQAEILNTAAAYVKAGGALVYSTCTILKRENSKVVEAFLEGHSDFIREEFDLPNIGRQSEITLLPHIHGTDGFYIAKLRRKDG